MATTRPPTTDRFIPCTGGVFVGAHGPVVYLRKQWCKNKTIWMDCRLCGCRLFGKTRQWARAGLTVNQVLDMCPVAVDGDGISIEESYR